MGPIVAMFSALSLISFHIRTGFGDSSKTYDGSVQDPYEGLGQGNGAAPAGWLVVSSVLLTFMRTVCACTKGVSAMSKRPFEYFAFGFVDDTDIPVMATSADETKENLFARLQTAVSHWGKTLQHTGGLLVNKNHTGGRSTLYGKVISGTMVNSQLVQRSLYRPKRVSRNKSSAVDQARERS